MKKKLNIGIVCYPTFGGSGTIASEVGLMLARKGHSVHFISSSVPGRLEGVESEIIFHEVSTADYPVFVSPPYTLSLASKIVEVSKNYNLDVLHVHYAVPHATSAFLARSILEDKAPKLVTTLHGTDITVVGKDPSYLPITKFSIEKSDVVTVPSNYLRSAVCEKLQICRDFPIEVIPNFIDTNVFKPIDSVECDLEEKVLLSSTGQQVCFKNMICHVSNFRPVKRIEDVIRIYALVKKEHDCSLVLIGDGPEKTRARELVRELGLCESVCFLGKKANFVNILARSKVFLLPSETESFGLAALEAMSCGVPVVGSNIDGIPEVVENGVNGFLCEVGNVVDMSNKTIELLKNNELRQRFSSSARARAVSEFSLEKNSSMYENLYY